MDVKTKLELMKVTDSYWDMLAEEVQIHIWNFKLCQEYPDELRLKQWKELCQELETVLNKL